MTNSRNDVSQDRRQFLRRGGAAIAGVGLGDWLGRSGTARAAVIFLASEASRFMTGQDLYIDGGWLAKGL